MQHMADVAVITAQHRRGEDERTDAEERYPALWTARKSDLCYATTNRQTAVQRLAAEATLILVVGSENSSNTQALVRVARKAGVDADMAAVTKAGARIGTPSFFINGKLLQGAQPYSQFKAMIDSALK